MTGSKAPAKSASFVSRASTSTSVRRSRQPVTKTPTDKLSAPPAHKATERPATPAKKVSKSTALGGHGVHSVPPTAPPRLRAGATSSPRGGQLPLTVVVPTAPPTAAEHDRKHARTPPAIARWAAEADQLVAAHAQQQAASWVGTGRTAQPGEQQDPPFDQAPLAADSAALRSPPSPSVQFQQVAQVHADSGAVHHASRALASSQPDALAMAEAVEDAMVAAGERVQQRRSVAAALEVERRRAAIMAQILQEQQAMLLEGSCVCQPSFSGASVDGDSEEEHKSQRQAPSTRPRQWCREQLAGRGGHVPAALVDYAVSDVEAPAGSDWQDKDAVISQLAVRSAALEAVVGGREAQLAQAGRAGQAWLADARTLQQAVAATLEALDANEDAQQSLEAEVAALRASATHNAAALASLEGAALVPPGQVPPVSPEECSTCAATHAELAQVQQGLSTLDSHLAAAATRLSLPSASAPSSPSRGWDSAAGGQPASAAGPLLAAGCQGAPTAAATSCAWQAQPPAAAACPPASNMSAPWPINTGWQHPPPRDSEAPAWPASPAGQPLVHAASNPGSDAAQPRSWPASPAGQACWAPQPSSPAATCAADLLLGQSRVCYLSPDRRQPASPLPPAAAASLAPPCQPAAPQLPTAGRPGPAAVTASQYAAAEAAWRQPLDGPCWSPAPGTGPASPGDWPLHAANSATPRPRLASARPQPTMAVAQTERLPSSPPAAGSRLNWPAPHPLMASEPLRLPPAPGQQHTAVMQGSRWPSAVPAASGPSQPTTAQPPTAGGAVPQYPTALSAAMLTGTDPEATLKQWVTSAPVPHMQQQLQQSALRQQQQPAQALIMQAQPQQAPPLQAHEQWQHVQQPGLLGTHAGLWQPPRDSVPHAVGQSGQAGSAGYAELHQLRPFGSAPTATNLQPAGWPPAVAQHSFATGQQPSAGWQQTAAHAFTQQQQAQEVRAAHIFPHAERMQQHGAMHSLGDASPGSQPSNVQPMHQPASMQQPPQQAAGDPHQHRRHTFHQPALPGLLQPGHDDADSGSAALASQHVSAAANSEQWGSDGSATPTWPGHGEQLEQLAVAHQQIGRPSSQSTGEDHTAATVQQQQEALGWAYAEPDRQQQQQGDTDSWTHQHWQQPAGMSRFHAERSQAAASGAPQAPGSWQPAPAPHGHALHTAAAAPAYMSVSGQPTPGVYGAIAPQQTYLAQPSQWAQQAGEDQQPLAHAAMTQQAGTAQAPPRQQPHLLQHVGAPAQHELPLQVQQHYSEEWEPQGAAHLPQAARPTQSAPAAHAAQQRTAQQAGAAGSWQQQWPLPQQAQAAPAHESVQPTHSAGLAQQEQYQEAATSWLVSGSQQQAVARQQPQHWAAGLPGQLPLAGAAAYLPSHPASRGPSPQLTTGPPSTSSSYAGDSSATAWQPAFSQQAAQVVQAFGARGLAAAGAAPGLHRAAASPAAEQPAPSGSAGSPAPAQQLAYLLPASAERQQSAPAEAHAASAHAGSFSASSAHSFVSHDEQWDTARGSGQEAPGVRSGQLAPAAAAGALPNDAASSRRSAHEAAEQAARPAARQQHAARRADGMPAMGATMVAAVAAAGQQIATARGELLLTAAIQGGGSPLVPVEAAPTSQRAAPQPATSSASSPQLPHRLLTPPDNVPASPPPASRSSHSSQAACNNKGSPTLPAQPASATPHAAHMPCMGGNQSSVAGGGSPEHYDDPSAECTAAQRPPSSQACQRAAAAARSPPCAAAHVEHQQLPHAAAGRALPPASSSSSSPGLVSSQQVLLLSTEITRWQVRCQEAEAKADAAINKLARAELARVTLQDRVQRRESEMDELVAAHQDQFAELTQRYQAELVAAAPAALALPDQPALDPSLPLALAQAELRAGEAEAQAAWLAGEAQQMADRLGQLEGQAAQAGQLQAALATAQDQMAALRRALTSPQAGKTEQDLEHSTPQEAEQRNLQSEADTLEELASQLQRKMQAANEAAAAARADAAAASSQAHEAQKSLAMRDAELAEARASLGEFEKQVAQAQAARAAAEGRLAAEQEQRASALSARDEAVARAEAAGGQLGEVREQGARLTAQLAAAHEEAAGLGVQLAAARDQADALALQVQELQGQAEAARTAQREAEAEAAVLLAQVAVQSQLAVAGGRQVAALHDQLAAHDSRHRLAEEQLRRGAEQAVDLRLALQRRGQDDQADALGGLQAAAAAPAQLDQLRARCQGLEACLDQERRAMRSWRAKAEAQKWAAREAGEKLAQAEARAAAWAKRAGAAEATAGVVPSLPALADTIEDAESPRTIRDLIARFGEPGSPTRAGTLRSKSARQPSADQAAGGQAPSPGGLGRLRSVSARLSREQSGAAGQRGWPEDMTPQERTTAVHQTANHTEAGSEADMQTESSAPPADSQPALPPASACAGDRHQAVSSRARRLAAVGTELQEDADAAVAQIPCKAPQAAAWDLSRDELACGEAAPVGDRQPETDSRNSVAHHSAGTQPHQAQEAADAMTPTEEPSFGHALQVSRQPGRWSRASSAVLDDAFHNDIADVTALLNEL